ncbi:MAG: phage terminase large subunit family protein, partial [Thermoplasmata archaeon]|nr:phage terminase large subunit family protein [Thermoplasmata archaeon]
TTIGLILMFCTIDLYPGPGLFITVNESLAKRFSKKRIDPGIRLMPSLRAKVKDSRSRKDRESTGNLLLKQFPGGSWILAGSNAAASYRSETARYVILDDFDGFEIDIEGEGDPGELADSRTGTFANVKKYINSTPTTVDTSLIESAYSDTSQGEWNIPCPRCGELQYLEWGDTDSEFGIKWTRNEDDEITDIWYECIHCNGRIDEHEKATFLLQGKYVHKYPKREKRGFRYNALYTPLGWRFTWKVLADKFIIATRELREGKPQRMKTFTNTMMAKAWEEKGKRPEWEDLYDRRDPDYADGDVPEGALLLSAGVDVQENRLVLKIKGWGRGEESWKIYHSEIYGDPMTTQPWDTLDQILNASYFNKDGQEFKVMSVCVDSGYLTDEVYNYCRTRQPRVHAIKGAKAAGLPVIGSKPTPQDVTFNGERIKDGAMLWRIGGDTAKDIIYSRLHLTGRGAGVYHWSRDTDQEYFKQLTGEKKVLRYVKGYPVHEWHKMRANDFLDAEIYAYAAALKIGMAQPGFWDALETFIKGPPPSAARTDPEQERRRQGGGNSHLGDSRSLMSGLKGKKLL